MKKWRWWAWLAIGLTAGAVVMAALLEWTRIDHAAIWSVELAMQGWVGAFIGAAVSVVVAVAVLRSTLRDERERADRQIAEERDRFTQQLQHERELALDERRSAAWAALMKALDPVDRSSKPSAETFAALRDAGQAYWVWRMHLGVEHIDMANAVWDAMKELQESVTSGDTEDWISELMATLETAGMFWHSPSGRETANLRRSAVASIRETLGTR